jgi:hypothetical protein
LNCEQLVGYRKKSAAKMTASFPLFGVDGSEGFSRSYKAGNTDIVNKKLVLWTNALLMNLPLWKVTIAPELAAHSVICSILWVESYFFTVGNYSVVREFVPRRKIALRKGSETSMPTASMTIPADTNRAQEQTNLRNGSMLT